jgi:hypothetical protein
MSTINNIEIKNMTTATVNGKPIPMFMLPQGYVRCSSNGFKDGTFAFTTCISDKKADIGVTLSHSEIWENQTIEPLFAIHFESIEQIEAYVKIFNEMLSHIKNMKTME